ncbi:hypothetical protein Hanom_Chr17g01572641 [Helianthus anomalus]
MASPNNALGVVLRLIWFKQFRSRHHRYTDSWHAYNCFISFYLALHAGYSTTFISPPSSPRAYNTCTLIIKITFFSMLDS